MNPRWPLPQIVRLHILTQLLQYRYQGLSSFIHYVKFLIYHALISNTYFVRHLCWKRYKPVKLVQSNVWIMSKFQNRQRDSVFDFEFTSSKKYNQNQIHFVLQYIGTSCFPSLPSHYFSLKSILCNLYSIVKSLSDLTL